MPNLNTDCTCDACTTSRRQDEEREVRESFDRARDAQGRFVAEQRISMNEIDQFNTVYTWPEGGHKFSVYVKPDRHIIFTATVNGVSAQESIVLQFTDMLYRASLSGGLETAKGFIQAKLSEAYYGTWQNEEGNMQSFYGNVFPVAFLGQVAQHVIERWDAANPICEVCDQRHEAALNTPEEERHFDCDECGDTHFYLTRVFVGLLHDGGGSTELILCENCSQDSDLVGNCYECGDMICPECSPAPESGSLHCRSCFDNNFSFCDNCGEYRYYDGFTHNDMDESFCSQCWREVQAGPGEIQSWNYRPNYVFHPDMPQDATKPLYIGMEVEVSLDHHYSPTSTPVVEWRNNTPEDLIFFKSDSSVTNGFEMVTHPMQPEWALKNMPWGWLDMLAAYAKPTDESTGTHIHVNKEAFTPTHLWKFMQIHFRLADFCGLVGGRGTTAAYGKLVSSSRSGPQKQRKDLMSIVKKKGAIQDYDRSIGLNVQNEYTIEMRYMRGGTSVAEMKKNIQWALALYEFSDQLKVRYVRDGVIDDPGYLMQWIKDRKDRFPELLQWIEARLPQPKPLPTYEEAR